MDITSKLKQDNRDKRLLRPQQKTLSPQREIVISGRDRQNSLTEQYYGSIEEQRSNYGNITEIVDQINSTQREFEDAQKRVNSEGLQKIMYSAYDGLMKACGNEKKQTSDIELFDRQISNVGSLNQILAGLTMNGSKELKEIEKRVDNIMNDSETSYNSIKSIENKLPGQIDELKKVKEKLLGIKREDDGYFELKKKEVMLERQVDDMYGRYSLTKQKYLGNSNHQENIIYMEKLYRASVQTAASLAVVTKQIGDTLVDTKKVFYGCDNLASASAAVSGGLDVLSEHYNRLNRKLTEGIGNMQQIIYENDNVNMIEGTNESLKSLIDDVKSLEYKQNRQTDNLLKR